MLTFLIACAAPVHPDHDEYGVPRADLAGCTAELSTDGVPASRHAYDEAGHIALVQQAESEVGWSEGVEYATELDELGRMVQRGQPDDDWPTTWSYVDDTWQVARMDGGYADHPLVHQWTWSEDEAVRTETDAEGETCSQVGDRLDDGIRFTRWEGDCEATTYLTWTDDRRTRLEQTDSFGSTFLDTEFDDAGRLAGAVIHDDDGSLSVDFSWSCP